MNVGLLKSGEVYLSDLLAFLERHGQAVLAGRVTLQLHPRGLYYISARLHSLEQLERIKASSPVDYFRGCVTDIQDFKRLEKLQHALQRVKSLTLVPAAAKLRDPTRIDLGPFRSLAQLQMRCCDLSTQPPLNVAGVRATLRSLACEGSLERLSDLLNPGRSEEVSLNPSRSFSTISTSSSGSRGLASGDAAGLTWPALVHLSVTHNDMPALDESLRLAPALESLDLSANTLTTIGYLEGCQALTNLALADNLLTDLSPLSGAGLRLTRLVLQCNLLRSTAGLESLHTLVELDLRNNLIADMAEVERIAGLAKLEVLWLEDNPVSELQMYHTAVLALFNQAATLCLDGIPTGPRHLAGVAIHRAKGGVMPKGWRVMLDFIEERSHWWRPRAMAERDATPTPPPGSDAAPMSPRSSAGSTAVPIAGSVRRRQRQHTRRIVRFPSQLKAAGGDEKLAQASGVGLGGDRPTSPLVVAFEAEAGEGHEVLGQSLMRTRVSSFHGPWEVEPTASQELEEGNAAELPGHSGGANPAGPSTSPVEFRTPDGDVIVPLDLTLSGVHLPPDVPEASVPKYSKSVTDRVYQGTLGELTRGLSVDPPEWLPPAEDYLQDSDSSPDTSPASSPGSFDSPLVSVATRRGTGPRPILRSNSKLLMKALRLSDSPMTAGSWGARPLAEARRSSADGRRSTRTSADGEVTVLPGGRSNVYGSTGGVADDKARRTSVEDAQ